MKLNEEIIKSRLVGRGDKQSYEDLKIAVYKVGKNKIQGNANEKNLKKIIPCYTKFSKTYICLYLVYIR